MTPRKFATVVIVAFLIGAFAAYCAYGTWRAHRIESVVEGMTKVEVRDAVGEPDVVRLTIQPEFSCSRSDIVEVWAYDLNGGQCAAFGFDKAGRVVCKISYFVAI